MSRVLPFLFLLVAGGLFIGYIHPTVTGPIAATQAKIKEYDAALSASTRYEERRAELEQERAQLPQDGVERLEDFLPDNVDNVRLILDLDSLASKSGLVITNFNTTAAEVTTSGDAVDTTDAPDGSAQTISLDPSKPYESLDLTITASGSYAQLRAFLSGVESSLRTLDLIEFQLVDSPTGVYKYQMTFRLYWLP